MKRPRKPLERATNRNWPRPSRTTRQRLQASSVEAARKANDELTDKAAYKNPALWVTAAILPLVYLVVSAVLFREGWTDEIKMMVVTAILTGVLGGVTGYWLGTSASSARKTELGQK